MRTSSSDRAAAGGPFDLPAVSPIAAVHAVGANAAPASVVLAGDPAFDGAWGPLVSVRADVIACGAPVGAGVAEALARIERRVAERRRVGGTSATGVAVLLSFELGGVGRPRGLGPAVPDLVAIEVDAAIAWSHDRPYLHVRGADGAGDVARVRGVLSGPRRSPESRPRREAPAPRTSLPREAYLRAVERVREHILAGDIYQANLTQTFRVTCSESALDVFVRLHRETAAPRSAFVRVDRWALASVSPEVFVDVDRHGRAETLPIKGTRPRGRDPAADARAAAELAASEKDRAELLMIVDLERNDLGRVCEIGSIAVPELATLRSFPAVHHLVARVTGDLRPGVGLERLVHATFPGGSISGAPKRRALEILRALEPCNRGWFTGSLLWLGDDGTTRSSILIRSVTLDGRHAWLGAGGGIVADSVAQLEWAESNAKARALAAVLGFVPEDAA